MNIILSGGGSAGHINPAIAIAKYFENHYENVNILFIGTKTGMENELVKKAGYNLLQIDVEGFKTSLSFKNLKPLTKFIIATLKMKKIIRNFKADIVVGTGGYVCAPAVAAANILKIPTLIHEQNVYPGSAIRFMAKNTTVTAISVEESRKYLEGAKNVVLTGNPVRESIIKADSKKAREELKIGGKKLVLVVGGSLGAMKINDVVCDYIKNNRKENVKFVISTGKRDYDRVNEKLKNVQNNGYFEILAYIHNMDTYLAAADLVICRSGAITLSEICVLKKPSILIPSPNVTHNHQEFNASALVNIGAAVMIKENNFDTSELKKAVDKLLDNDALRNQYGENAYKLAKKDASRLICESIIKFAR